MLSGGFEVSAVCVSYFQKYHELAAYVSSNAIDFIIGIHAFRAGKLLCGNPFSLQSIANQKMLIYCRGTVCVATQQQKVVECNEKLPIPQLIYNFY